jgi:hypothetical protein
MDCMKRKRSDSAHHAESPAPTPKFDVEKADASRVVDEIVALRAALAAMEKSPFSAAAKAPLALRQLLEVLENINLRLADLESGS